MTRIVTVTSGKGGVGKTVISVNMALQLAAFGCRTCLFDADLGLANVNILLGLTPKRTLADVILNDLPLQDIIIHDYKGIDIIPGSSGVEKIADLRDDQVKRLIESFSQMDGYDLVLFDTSAGISRNVIPFCLACAEVLVIITPEPTSLTDAYALLKVISLNKFKGAIKVIVNRCENDAVAREVYSRFSNAVQKYLDIEIVSLGNVIEDRRVAEAVGKQLPLQSLYPESPASKSIKNMARYLLLDRPEEIKTSSMVSFWADFLNIIKGPLKLTGSKRSRTEAERPSAMKERQFYPRQSDQEMSLLLNELIRNVSLLSKELRLLRQTINRGEGASLQSSSSESKEKGEIGSNSIQLDFQAFLKNRIGGRNNA